MSIVRDILEIIRVNPLHLLALSTCGIVVVSLPGSWRIYFGYDALLLPYRGWGSLACIPIFVYAMILLGAATMLRLAARWREWRAKRRLPEDLSDLSWQEKELVWPLIEGDLTTTELVAGDGIAEGLVRKMILYRPSVAYGKNGRAPYNLNPDVRNLMKRRPALREKIRTEK